MKSNAPWSVKGIERDARETAKEAAKREGMTVGEWLNQMIYTVGDPESSGGEVEGLQLRDIVTAIEHLNKRVADSHLQTADHVGDVTRKIGDVVERVQRLERIKPAEGTNDDLAVRVEKLEIDSNDRERINALKALEKAVAQVAVQFNTAQKTSIERLDATERQLQEFAERMDSVGSGDGENSGNVTEVGFLKDAIDGLSLRISRTEKMTSEAARLKEQAGASMDPDFVESTGNRLRILGDEIKRSGDQIRTLETTIAKLSHQIDAAERRSAEGVQKVTDTLADLRENLGTASQAEPNRADIEDAVASASKETEARIEKLQSSFETMIDRLEAFGEPAPKIGREEAPATIETPEDGADAAAETAADDALESAFSFDEIDGDDIEDSLPASEPAPASDEDVVYDDALTQASDEDDEDPFAFVDEIDAALEEEPASDTASDDFTFELDDGPDAEPQNEPDEGARALLSEVQNVFTQKPVSEAADDDEDDAEADDADDIDQILAALDGFPEAAHTSAPDTELSTEEDDTHTKPASADLEDSPTPSIETNDGEEEQEDFLKAARRRAKEAAERAEQEKKSPRRNLTPKQKAILAARARKKRLAEARTEKTEPSADNKAAAAAAARDALRDTVPTAVDYDNATTDEEEKSGPFAGIAAALSGVIANLPFIGKKADETDEDDLNAIKTFGKAAPLNDEEKEGPRKQERAAFDTLKSKAGARPLTLALGVGILLSFAALFFVIKDIAFKPANNTSRSTPATTAPVTSTDTQPSATDISSDDALEVPAPPAIDPRTLYSDAMAGLSAAETESETSAAIGKLQDAAALGHPPAQLQLGEFYKTGQAVEQDLGRARTWFRRAANGGNVLAMHRIGIMTARGEGGTADAGEAIGWFELAGNRGLVDSQYNLGAIFHPTGDSNATSIQDAGKAYFWYSLAAKNGDQQAQPLAAGVAATLSATEKATLDKSIAEWEALPADKEANALTPAG